MKILLVEDEPVLAKSMFESLSGQGYVCDSVSTLGSALENIALADYDCIVLDLSLPDGEGFTLLRELKKAKKSEGLIIVSARTGLEDKLEGLELGADDYLTKPFHLSELNARILSIIRRRQLKNDSKILENDLEIDLFGKLVVVKKQQVMVTRKEFDLLVYLIANKNRVVSKTAVAEHLSGDQADLLDDLGFVYTHVKNLKKKLAEAGLDGSIRTLYGTGYQWIN